MAKLDGLQEFCLNHSIHFFTHHIKRGTLVLRHSRVNDDGTVGRVPAVVKCGQEGDGDEDGRKVVEVKVRDFDFYWRLFNAGDEGALCL